MYDLLHATPFPICILLAELLYCIYSPLFTFRMLLVLLYLCYGNIYALLLESQCGRISVDVSF